MTLFVYMTPFETAAKLFEVFIIDGEQVLLKMLLRMIELKERKIMRLEDMHLQQYMLSGLTAECMAQYPMSKLLD